MESSIQVSGRELRFNKQGFMVDFDEWSRDAAEAIAAAEGLSLTDCHWVAIEFLRDYYRTYEVPPSPRVVIQSVGDRLAEGLPCNRKTLEDLFPKGGCKQACRIAGLPRHYCHAC